MEKDLIIGAFKNYTFNQVKPWIESINQCGFKGDKVIISVGSSNETNQKLTESGWKVISAPSQSNMMFHMERFIHIYGFLKQYAENYRYVITTDVRDVIFQSDPTPFLEEKLQNHNLIAVSEAIQVKNEKWNRDNILKSFGEFFYNEIKENEIYNVGTISGKSEYVRDLCGMLFQLSFNRADWVADQAAYNVLLNWHPYKDTTYYSTLQDGWACNLHVTNKPDQLQEFGPYLLEKRPVMESDIVKDGQNNKPFVIVHQYDRVPEWKKIIESKFEKEDEAQYFTYKI